MIIRNNDFPNYIVKRHGNGVTIFRDGENKPLKPIKGNKRELVFHLWVNGCRIKVPFFEFFKGCIDDLNLKLK